MYISVRRSHLQDIPNVDVVCYGLWVTFISYYTTVCLYQIESPEILGFHATETPSLEDLERLSKTHLFLMDIGILILSDRAIEVLMKRSLKK